MIAVFILTVCLAPTLRIFTNMYLSQQQIVRENQKSHLVHIAHSKVVEKLYKREIPIMDISAKKIHPIDDPDIKELLKETPFQLSYELSIEKEGKVNKEEEDESTGEKKEVVDYLCKLNIQVQELNSRREPCSEENFEYYIYIDTRSEEEAEEKNCEDEELETETEGDEEELRERAESDEDETEYDDDDEYEFDDDDDEYEFDDDDEEEEDFPYKRIATGGRS